MFSSLSRKRVVVLLILTSLLLISLDRRHIPAFDAARTGFQKVLEPFDAAADSIAKPIARAWNGITDYERLQRDNEALRDQLDAQKGADVVARSVIIEYDALLQLVQLSKDYPHVIGRVVGSAPSNFQNTVEISVGADRGVRVGMPVLSNAGLIGKITRVYASSAEVRLITDPSYSVRAEVLAVNNPVPEESTTTAATTPSGAPVVAPEETSTTTTVAATPPPTSAVPALGRAATTAPASSTTNPNPSTSVAASSTTAPVEAVRETGILQGQGNGKPIVLRFVDDTSTANLKVGDTVQTAGGAGDLAPEGLPIGVISKISPQTGSRALIVEVEPSASVNRLNFVSVVLYTPDPPAGG